MKDLFTVDVVAAISAIVGVITWLVRLESKVKINAEKIFDLDKGLDHLEVKHEALYSKIAEELSQVRESLARIEGVLSLKKD